MEPAENVKLTAEEFGAKARDKVEVYHVCAHVFGAYIPSIDQITTWHMRDLMTGVKKRIDGQSVKFLHVPQYEKLTIPDLIGYIGEFPFVQMCLPDKEKEITKLGR